MSHKNLAKETFLQFMQAMYSWERKATRNLRNKADKEMLKDELATIFDQFCTSKKTLRGHCPPIMGQEKNPLMRPVFCTLQETGHLISVEF